MNLKLKLNSKLFYYFLFTIFICLSILFSFPSTCFGAYPKLVKAIMSAFEKVKDYIVAISTPAAAVSIGCRISNAKI